MALPKIQAPIYNTKLPVLDKKIQYRPFTVKEEKLLLMAAESSTADDVFTAFQQVINNCIVTEGVDAAALHLFDLEVLFLLLRAASVGNEATLLIRDKQSNKPVEIVVDLNAVVEESIRNANIPSKQIPITDDIGLVMKDITLSMFLDIASSGEELNAEEAYGMIKKLIDKVYDSENVQDLSDYSDAEVDEFLESFRAHEMEKLYNYLQDMPRVRATVPYTVDGEERELTLEGVTDFFQSA